MAINIKLFFIGNIPKNKAGFPALFFVVVITEERSDQL
ncbi:hypothetical protein CSC17_0757 [Klebsiella oxytoca]|nr:hypothetical protein CSC17_0757 [Klebsiella oxytoca]